MKTIKIDIHKDGSISFDFDGYVGRECFSERQKIEELLKKRGVVLNEEYVEKKSEAYVEDKTEVGL